jgi:hypothetical protein
VSKQDVECPECGAALAAQTPVTSLPVASDHGDEVLPIAIARLERGALPASAGRRPATPALHIARFLTVAMMGWVMVQTGLSWRAYSDGYIDSLVPSWNLVFTAGVGFITFGVLQRRRWALGWARGTAMFNALGNGLVAMAGTELFWIGVLVQVSCAVALYSARDEFADGPKDGLNARLGKVLGVLAIAGSIYVGFAARTNHLGTERGREAFAREVQQSYHDAGARDVHVSASRRTLVIESPESDAAIDASAAVLRAEIEKHPRSAKAWLLGFERIRVTNGSHEALILAPR